MADVYIILSCYPLDRSHHLDDADGDISSMFVYTGGVVPEHLKEHMTHARIDKSVKIIDRDAFRNCPNLLHVDFHDKVERVRKWAFHWCPSLGSVNNLLGVKVIEEEAFIDCFDMVDLAFGNELETVGRGAFYSCHSLRHLNIPSIRTIEEGAFFNCTGLMDAEFGVGLGSIENEAFEDCTSLRRIAIPLKDDMFTFNDEYEAYTQFDFCAKLGTVDLVGEIHKTLSPVCISRTLEKLNESRNRPYQPNSSRYPCQ